VKRKRLGRSDLEISEIGLGCMSIGTDEAKAAAIIHEAMDRGVNFFDTADLYDHGRNEELVGKALKNRRADVIIATKVGNRRIPGREGWVWDPSKSYILAAVKESLRRLGTDYIDLYQLHGGTIDDPIDETIEAFEELKRAGVIRWYGISSIRPNVIREYVRRSNLVGVMSQYSMLDRRPEEEVLPLLAEHGIGLIARGPLAGGILTESGGRKAERDYLDYSREELPAVRRKLIQLSGNQRSLEQTAIRYVLEETGTAAALPGASSPAQLRGTLSAAEAEPLTPEERAAIRSVTHANRYTQHR
jgi:aryl-alcohol dehydrogenase-like predicted oxidoreductase